MHTRVNYSQLIAYIAPVCMVSIVTSKLLDKNSEIETTDTQTHKDHSKSVKPRGIDNFAIELIVLDFEHR